MGYEWENSGIGTFQFDSVELESLLQPRICAFSLHHLNQQSAMSQPPSKNSIWAQEHGYQFHAETNGASFEDARKLSIFRRADGYREHVHGVFRGRSFEILDAQVRHNSENVDYHVWQTIVVVRTSGMKLPTFELMPRRETPGMGLLGIKGLELTIPTTASPDEQRLVAAFSKNYSLFRGGAHASIEASLKSTDASLPNADDLALMRKPSVLRFLSTAVTGSIEVRNGLLAIRAPETRVIRAAISDTILEGKDRDDLLTVANDLLDAFANSENESPLGSFSSENTFRPASFAGGLIGGAIGFLLGGGIGILVAFLLKGMSFFLIPVLAFVGFVLGQFLGKALTRSK